MNQEKHPFDPTNIMIEAHSHCETALNALHFTLEVASKLDNSRYYGALGRYVREMRDIFADISGTYKLMGFDPDSKLYSHGGLLKQRHTPEIFLRNMLHTLNQMEQKEKEAKQ